MQIAIISRRAGITNIFAETSGSISAIRAAVDKSKTLHNITLYSVFFCSLLRDIDYKILE
jgi:hypothetical protein